ncbi:uncharacterized protein LOC133799910 [Humulus lupulus]|uniref:uncharacterized protein LOC133799910 n=1 Tax=Humulus lupulus TaxID=3486 RepID=UPI002B4104BE|nr:uncharacterized protein LOC133799910 [Humulus lupulus]
MAWNDMIQDNLGFSTFRCTIYELLDNYELYIMETTLMPDEDGNLEEPEEMISNVCSQESSCIDHEGSKVYKGLKPMIAKDVKMTSVELVSYVEILDKALDVEYMEDCIWKYNASRRETNKKKALKEKNKKKAQESQSSGIDKRPKATAPNGNNYNNHNNHNNNNNHGNHQNHRTEYPNFPKCSRKHLGEC